MRISLSKILSNVPRIIVLSLVIATAIEGSGSIAWNIAYWAGLSYISVFGPIFSVLRLVFPKREKEYAKKHSRMPIKKWNDAYIKASETSTRFAGFFGILGINVLMSFAFIFFARHGYGYYFYVLVLIQTASLISAFLFAKFFPNKFFAKYKTEEDDISLIDFLKQKIVGFREYWRKL